MRTLLATIAATLMALTVQAEPVTARVAWDNPTENVDGTPLTDLAGTRVYRGTTSSNYTYVMDAGPTNACTMPGFEVGVTYYLATVAYALSGAESAFSKEYVFTPADESVVYPSSPGAVYVMPQSREVHTPRAVEVDGEVYWRSVIVTQTNWHDDVWVDVQAGEWE